MEYWVYPYSNPLKNITIHGINKSWAEKSSTEVLKGLGFGKNSCEVFL